MKKSTRVKIAIAVILQIVAIQASTMETTLSFISPDKVGCIISPPSNQQWESGATTVRLNENGVLTVSGLGAMEDYGIYVGVPPWHCHWISNFVIEEGVTHIGAGAFISPSGPLSRMLTDMPIIDSITIPNSVVSIGESAFRDRHELRVITIGDGVNFIGDEAFFGCISLASVISLNPVPPEIGPRIFDDLPSNACLYVPEDSINIYRAAEGWSHFNCIKEFEFTPKE
ncbi:MAG: leucine-rich repeat domain-containing protein [Chitinispirillales bacterium]|jgi:hypothetical protein|nr:leucine-rich repeat domain-containing protein [Chitinispirillales bacterium]